MYGTSSYLTALANMMYAQANYDGATSDYAQNTAQATLNLSNNWSGTPVDPGSVPKNSDNSPISTQTYTVAQCTAMEQYLAQKASAAAASGDTTTEDADNAMAQVWSNTMNNMNQQEDIGKAPLSNMQQNITNLLTAIKSGMDNLSQLGSSIPRVDDSSQYSVRA